MSDYIFKEKQIFLMYLYNKMKSINSSLNQNDLDDLKSYVASPQGQIAFTNFHRHRHKLPDSPTVSKITRSKPYPKKLKVNFKEKP